MSVPLETVMRLARDDMVAVDALMESCDGNDVAHVNAEGRSGDVG
ncbi:MAG: hypothetical protein QUS11_09370 [Candidatus Fermentibacter sp.]|nr:hypothetical protein [Candidatus Fermentibacter sp.]